MPESLAGHICIWNGLIADIPFGWALCDGTNGTPDLRDRFIVGAGDTYAVNDGGGARTHTHTFTSDGHKHSLKSPTISGPGSGANYEPETTTDTDSGTTNPTNHDPPWFSLAYIMNL